MSRYEGCMQNPWDDISIQYVLVCAHIAKKRYIDAFKEESQLVTLSQSVFVGFLPSYNLQQTFPEVLYRKPGVDITCTLFDTKRSA